MKKQQTIWQLIRVAAAMCAVVAASTASAGTFYNTEAAFTMQLSPGSYLEDFSGFTFGSPLDGTQTTWAAPGANGFGWTASAALGLYSNVSALSTNTANDPLMIMFTGAPVTAFGGIFANTDISGNIIPGTITVTTSDGGNFVIPTTNSFLGYTASVGQTITSVTMLAQSGATNNWVQVDHFYTGMAAVPEPTTVGLLALGAVAMAGTAIKRRRS